MNVVDAPRRATRVRLPVDVERPFEVYLNGVEQREGRDFTVRDGMLVFDRPLAKQPRAKRMNGAGEKALEIAQSAVYALSCECPTIDIRSPIKLTKLLLQSQMEPTAQLRSRLARERHGGHVVDFVDARGNPGSHALGEHLCLAGTSARLEKKVDEQLLADEAARFTIDS